MESNRKTEQIYSKRRFLRFHKKKWKDPYWSNIGNYTMSTISGNSKIR